MARQNPGQVASVPGGSTDIDIQAAIDAMATAGGGTVLLDPGIFTINAAIVPASNVSVVGVRPALAFTTDMPDEGWTLAGGTRFVAGTATQAFAAATGSVALPTHPALSQQPLNNVEISSIGFSGFVNALAIGGHNNLGPAYSTFRHLYITNNSGRAFDIQNAQHIEMDDIQGYHVGGAGRITANMDLFAPGNSKASNICMILNPVTTSTGLEVGSIGAAALNIWYFTHIQIARFGGPELVDAASFTNGSPSIVVGDSTKFPVGMPVQFGGNWGNFKTGPLYFVLTSAANVITVSANGRGGAAQSANATGGGIVIKTKGQPLLDLGGKTPSCLSFAVFDDIDVEGTASCGIYAENVTQGYLLLAEAPGSTYVGICGRGGGNLRGISTTSWTTDMGALLESQFSGGTGGPVANAVSCNFWGYDQVNRVDVLRMINGGDLVARQSTFYPLNAPMCQQVTALDVTSALGNANGGLVVANAAAAITYTLPTIVDSSVFMSNKGLPYEIVNHGAGTLTVSTNGTQDYNGNGKFHIALTTGQTATIRAARTAGGTLFWAVTYTNGTFS